MENKKVIQVKDLTKMYKLYDKPSDRLKEALGLTRKKLYKEHYALHDVNFDIYEGECVGIIGTNGSGKSTILKIITGVLTPTAGEVKVDGRISALLELGAGFNMEYSGLENVYLNGTMIGFSKEEIDARLKCCQLRGCHEHGCRHCKKHGRYHRGIIPKNHIWELYQGIIQLVHESGDTRARFPGC